MHFYETQRGHYFFDSQLPKLIQLLENIEKHLSQGALKQQPTLEPDSGFLQNLYYGNYDAEQYQEREHIKPLSREVIRLDTALRQFLTPQEIQLFEDYHQAITLRNDAVAEQAYEAGFRTAVQMMLAGCSAPGKEKHGETGTA